jgi:hypothetical protein
LTLTAHTRVQAVFAVLVVNTFTDSSDSAATPGTLRYALTNAQNGETVRVDTVTPGQTVIELSGRLPNITKNITIEGNGVTITRNDAWTTINNDSQFMYIDNGTVMIRRIHFKNGRAGDGAAINKNKGNLTLESCIFSGNQASNAAFSNGGAIYNREGKLDVRGCTFYQNSADTGGAIIDSSSTSYTLTLTGNLFYGNTAEYKPILHYTWGPTTSLYNVADFSYGAGGRYSTDITGWNAGTGDTTFTNLSISGDPVNSTFAPVNGLKSVIPSAPEGFPATDFYGNTRTFPGAPGAVR